MIPNFDQELFKKRYEKFKKIDDSTFPYNFQEFWRYKIKVEINEGHILDDSHRKETFHRLSETLRRWQWHRPYKFTEVAERLKVALERISNTYNEVREYSLLEFNEIPSNLLEIIWHELGRVKTGENRNPSGYYLVMGATKPLMFLWGQTLAFDSIVRRRMPVLITGIRNCYWTFETWKNVMIKFQESLKQQPEFLVLLKEVTQKEYGTRELVPYGQFLDLYWWAQ